MDTNPFDSEHTHVPMIPRELSWLSFNGRVLQEAADTRNPAIERLRFLGIYSNNMDEFFRVRVADVKRRILLKKYQASPDEDAEQLLQDIQQKVIEQGEQFNQIYKDIQLELRKHSIELIDNSRLTEQQLEWIRSYFRSEVKKHISPIILSNEEQRLARSLEDNTTYLFVEMSGQGKPEYAIVEVPTQELSRFVELPLELNTRKKNGHYRRQLLLLDDILLLCLADLFSGFFEFEQIQGYSLKMTRDAEYNISDTLDQSLLDKMSKGIRQRLKSEPVRLVYDKEMPEAMLKVLRKQLGTSSGDSLIPGGRYRNFKDFIGFPNMGHHSLEFAPLPPLPSPEFEQHATSFDAIRASDILLHYPYQDFGYFTEWIRQASFDPKVSSIKLTMYRVAKNSRVISSLVDAVRNGKKVVVVVELKARFDEENNINWSRRMTEAGIHVVFGLTTLKIHSKLCLITRLERGKAMRYAHIGTGNFNEKTARIYTDMSLFSCHPELTAEVDQVFEFIEYSYRPYQFQHLIVSPTWSRPRLMALIQREIAFATSGRKAEIILKVNNLVDKEIIALLYQASQAGVKIRMIIRGMCSLIPGVPGLSQHIKVVSVLDRFLEHSRVYVFHNGGETEVYISSADWMTRNIDHRVEVGVPIYDLRLKQQILDILHIQLKDNVKGRLLDANQSNSYVKRGNKRNIRSQQATYDYLAALQPDEPARTTD
ncbi:polyphosphate kinase 1 [Alkalimonas delamerensis]|uniref:Polyphosphate kinase n=1 Tax=Alkalimonas delamerensis TaxID=265981 RepID=A0ABT9GQJ5_9GAMM|nr:polyphosphate kinase 1 [Alkalimonas delamerensis]MDP4529252.1 polyphosphate kinase 1 [Alkalimonas delamerensis]